MPSFCCLEDVQHSFMIFYRDLLTKLATTQVLGNSCINIWYLVSEVLRTWHNLYSSIVMSFWALVHWIIQCQKELLALWIAQIESKLIKGVNNSVARISTKIESSQTKPDEWIVMTWISQSVKYNTHVTVLNVRLVSQGMGSSFWIAPHFTLLSLSTTVRLTYLALASSHYIVQCSIPHPFLSPF
jgi:hypothetical protein